MVQQVGGEVVGGELGHPVPDAAERDLSVGGRGFADVALAEVCELAGVTRGALYHHFAGKEGLFRAVCEHVGAA